MKWLLIALAVLTCLVMLVVTIGLMLPTRHVAAMAATCPAPPDSVWDALNDPAAFPSWRKDVKQVEMLSGPTSSPSWREISSHGGISFVREAAERPHRLVTRIVDRDLSFGGRWEYRITPAGQASLVTVTEYGEVYNPVFRFVSRFVMRHTATIDTFLRALGKRFNANVVPKAVPKQGAA